MNLRINQAEPTRSISGRGRVCQVFPRKSLGLSAAIAFFGVSSARFEEHRDIVSAGTVEKINLAKLAKLPG